MNQDLTPGQSAPHYAWIQSVTGQEIDLIPGADDSGIKVYDIAWSLSQTNRFGGRCIRPYSVAEHCLLVTDIVEGMGGSYRAQFAALLHDAHEALDGDIITPNKLRFGPGCEAATEASHKRVIRSLCGVWRLELIDELMHGHEQTIKTADMIALATERAALLPHPGRAWPQLEGVPKHDINLMTPELVAMDWEAWRDAWLDRFHELFYAVTEVAFAGVFADEVAA